ncbi:hypothetical protein ACS0TY_019534 [Phlomoides rotata]
MSCLAWNCRGLGNPRKVPTLKKEISSKGHKFIFLSETKLLVVELCRVAMKLGFDFYFAVDCVVTNGGRMGGLSFLWQVDCFMELCSFYKNHIDVQIGGGDAWRFTSVYGVPEDNKKWKTWRLLETLAGNSSLPWLCVGNFNEILFEHEKMGGNLR